MAYTSRERVEAVLNHEEPDRVPLDIWGSASRINTELYLEMDAFLGIDSEKNRRLIRPLKDTKYEDYALADALECDFRHINIWDTALHPPVEDENGLLIDEWKIGRAVVSRHPTIVLNPLKDAEMEDLEAYELPDPYDPTRYEGLAELAKYYYEETDKYVTACSANSGQVFDVCQYLRGTENFLMDLYLEEDFARLMIRKINDYLIALNLEYMKHIGPYIQCLEFTSDFGAQNAAFISTETFRDFFKEPYTELFQTIKSKYPHVKIFLHSCGDVFDLIDEFIDCGVDIMNPLQPTAKHMDRAAIKERYGSRVCFHGAIDIQNAIFKSDEVFREELKTAMRTLAPGGGYICSPANHIQFGTPVENAVNLYRYAKEYGTYPISC